MCEDEYFIPDRLALWGKFPIQAEYEETYHLMSLLKFKDQRSPSNKYKA